MNDAENENLQKKTMIKEKGVKVIEISSEHPSMIEEAFDKFSKLISLKY